MVKNDEDPSTQENKKAEDTPEEDPHETPEEDPVDELDSDKI